MQSVNCFIIFIVHTTYYYIEKKSLFFSATKYHSRRSAFKKDEEDAVEDIDPPTDNGFEAKIDAPGIRFRFVIVTLYERLIIDPCACPTESVLLDLYMLRGLLKRLELLKKLRLPLYPVMMPPIPERTRL